MGDEKYELYFYGQYDDPDDNQLSALLDEYYISRSFLEVIQKRQSGVAKRNLLLSEAKQLAGLFIEQGVMVNLQLQFDAEAWVSGLKTVEAITEGSAAENTKKGNTLAGLDTKSEAIEPSESCKYSFPMSKVRPTLFLPQRIVTVGNKSGAKLIFHRPSLPYKITLLIALCFSLALNANLLPLLHTILPLETWSKQLLGVVTFVGAVFLFARSIYPQQRIEIDTTGSSLLLAEQSEVWHRSKNLVLKGNDGIESIKYNKAKSSLIYSDKNGEEIFSYQLTNCINQSALDSLNNVNSELMSNLFDVFNNIKQLINKLRGISSINQNQEIRFSADILDNKKQKVALVTIGNQLTLTISPTASSKYNHDKLLAFTFVLSNSVYE